MKITTLGRWGAYPEAGEATAGYLIEHQGFNLLLDCGSGVLAQLQKVLPIEQLDALLISHFHHDHVADVGCLQYAIMIGQILDKRKNDLAIYAPNQPIEKWNALKGVRGTTIFAIEAEKSIEIGPMKFEFIQTIHPIHCLAVRISTESETLVYTADTSFFPDLILFSKNADILIAETSFYAHQDGTNAGHMNSTEVGKLARQANVKKLLLTHLPHFGNINDLVVEANKEFEGPVELLEIGKVHILSK